MDTKPGVLVLDDDEDVRAILSELLDFHGFHAIGAGSGEEALAKLEEERPPVGRRIILLINLLFSGHSPDLNRE